MTCDICTIIEKKKKVKKVYEDDTLFAYLAEKPGAEGHTIITTKKHQQILTQTDDDTVKKIFACAQQLSSILFESANAEGSNILIQNGTIAGQVHPHLLTHILPRSGSDGLNCSLTKYKIVPGLLATLTTP